MKAGSRLRAAFSLTTGDSIATPRSAWRTRPARPAASEHRQRSLRVRVRDHRRAHGSAPRCPISTPSPGMILRNRDPRRDRGARVHAPPARSRTRPAPCRPRRSPTPRRGPSRSPWWCISFTDAVPGSRGPANAPITPWPKSACLMPLVGDVAVERLGDRLLEHDRDQLLVVAQHLLDLLAARRGPAPGVAARPISEQPPKAAEHLLVGDHAAHVGLGEPVRPHVLGGPVAVAEDSERAAVRERAPEVGVADEDAITAPLELQLADDDLVQQADHVRAGADQVARDRRKGCSSVQAPPSCSRRSSTSVRAAGPGQIGRGSQAVVAAADDDRIPVVRRERGHGLREAYAAEYLVDVDHRGQANGEAMERASRQSATITCRERW